MYRKDILYLNLWKSGEKIGNVGYVKSMVRDEQQNLMLHINKLDRIFDGEHTIRLEKTSGRVQENGICIRDGQAVWNYEGDLCDPSEIEIILTDEYRIGVKSKTHIQNNDSRFMECTQNRTDADLPYEKKKEVQIVTSEQENANPDEEETLQRKMQEKESVDVKEYARMEMQEKESADAIDFLQRKAHAPEDKWQQLLTKYDRIHPYGDNRIYIKLEPKDFIILPEKYQHLVNNSFLLHGFYNYRYIILGKEEQYYLGVPGNYYEREKMVALMFGFDHFESAKEAVTEGDFGYYLRVVEL